jgi:hypothetical protein
MPTESPSRFLDRVGILKMLAVLVVALGMAAVESVRPGPVRDEDGGDALFVGSAAPRSGLR